jgi:hypothetical protein
MCVMACTFTAWTTSGAKPWPSEISQNAGVRSASRAVKSRVASSFSSLGPDPWETADRGFHLMKGRRARQRGLQELQAAPGADHVPAVEDLLHRLAAHGPPRSF